MDYVYIGLISYFIIINLTGIILMIVDKRRSKQRAWRISESKLIMIAVFGGAAGMLVTSRMIRHKTKKMKFLIVFPLFIAIHLIVVLYWF
ncbi:DUF1294 domain-containing protein [Salipaludibacillus daqingensis]|uniref:DUF1294 domain-containing protein n=1 Tax=Salipaludibacillus daqingensis TaxID=3041001 RepID=UPI0024750AD1|nr:DUF1294 domain-containing protein [Salipaludibacillus daqingensis]